MKQHSTNSLWGRLLAWTLAAALLFSNLEGAAFVRAEGAKAAPIEIGSVEDLQKIGTEGYPMSGDYALAADIDLSDIQWTPMGGYIGNKGSCNPEDANVFSGTFDGRGYVISGLTIDLDGPVTGTGVYGQVGFFSVIGSNNENDYAEVKNMIFTDVNIHTDFANTDGIPLATVGTLAGEVNGYAKISNIAVLNGNLDVNDMLGCNTVGAGGIIGECRTAADIKNNYISVTDCYNGADIRARGTESNLEYAGGIIGRVTESPCKEITRCVNTGEVLYCGNDGYGIAAANSANASFLANLSNSYFRAVTEQRTLGNVTALSEAEITSGTLPEGLQGGKWRAVKGGYPFPAFCYDSSAAGMIYLSGVSLGFAEKESATGVKTQIELPNEVGGHVLNWKSSNQEVLSIEDGMAVAHRELLGTDTVVMLTAETPKAENSADNYSRSFKLTVLADDENKPSFVPGYATEGEELKVSIPNVDPANLTYQWKVDAKEVAVTPSYTPTAADLEKFISVTATAEDGKHWDLSMYFSKLPVVYVDTVNGDGVTNKNIAKDATIRIQGNEEFSDTDTWYEGETTIKGRGNSTWDYAFKKGDRERDVKLKLPYKLKLGSKANLLGLGSGANKHWVLLANLIDHTNMRNEVAHKFAKGIGMETTVNDTGVVLILNGQYQGMYELSEHVRVGSARVNVFEWEEMADDIAKAVCKKEAVLDKSALETYLEENLEWTKGSFQYQGNTYTVSDYYTDPIPDITGGFLLDMDFRSDWDEQKFISTFKTKHGVPMFFRAPEYAKTNPEMVQFAKGYVDAYESCLESPDFTAEYDGKTVHYSDLFDMDSLLQYWMLCEYVNNWDSMKNSSYLYKDLEGKAKMGPAWDYDWAWGNINMYSNARPFVYDNWHTTLCGIEPGNGGFAEYPYQKSQWHTYLVKDPYFVTRAWEYYQKYKDTVIGEMMKEGGTIDKLKEKYATAAKKNDEKWSWSYSEYNGKAFVNGSVQNVQSQEYEAAVDSLKTFITKRMEWMDRQFTDVQTLYTSLENSVSNQITVAVPVAEADESITLNAEVTASNAASVVFLINGCKVLKDGEAKVAVSDGKASVTASKDMLLGNMLNTVEVLGVDSSGNYISGLMNFTTFEGPEVRLDGDVTVSSDRAGDKSYPGDTLTAVATITGDIKGNLTYQWFAGEAAIAGATKSSYQLTKAEIGKTVSVKVGSTVEVGTLDKAYGGAVAEKPTTLTGKVKISAEPVREGNVSYPGDTLKAKVSEDTNTGELLYQWYADDTKIKGATKKSYVLTESEIGKTISVKVESDEQSGTLDKVYDGAVVQNPGTGPDDPAVLTGTVSVTSSRVGDKSYPGDTLTATVSEDCNYTGTLSYQWYAGETAIAGATKATYVLTEAEIGKKIGVEVASSEQSGTLKQVYAGSIIQDKGTDPDTPAVLTGTVGVASSRTGGKSYPGDTLTASVSGSNNSGELKFQWCADGKAIAGAAKSSYVLTANEIGKKLTVEVTSSVETGKVIGTYAGTVIRKPVMATSIKLSVKSKKMYAYQTLQLKATVKPQGASQNVEYKTSKKSVATVSKTGKITAKAPGTAKITVKAKDGSKKTVSCNITVLKPVIKISGKTTIKLKKSTTLKATAYGLKGAVKWKLDAKGKKLLKLNKTSGNKVKLTAKKKTGTAKLTITCGKKKVTKTIRVKK